MLSLVWVVRKKWWVRQHHSKQQQVALLLSLFLLLFFFLLLPISLIVFLRLFLQPEVLASELGWASEEMLEVAFLELSLAF